MSQLIHHRFHIPLHPVLRDKAVMDAVEEHQVTRDLLSSGCDAGEFSLMDSIKGSSHCYDVALGDDLMRNQLIAREGSEAMVRLAGRLTQRGEDPETLAGLVQVLRCCGLHEESIAAHQRAIALDPTVKTRVAHTHFLRGEFSRVFETYNSGAGYYLDAAAWAGLGAVDRAVDLLRTRLSQFQPGPSMSSLMASLLAVLEDRREDAIALMESKNIIREPEGLFYLARHCGMVNAAAPEFGDELQEARRFERHACQVFHETLGQPFVR